MVSSQYHPAPVALFATGIRLREVAGLCGRSVPWASRILTGDRRPTDDFYAAIVKLAGLGTANIIRHHLGDDAHGVSVGR